MQQKIKDMHIRYAKDILFYSKLTGTIVSPSMMIVYVCNTILLFLLIDALVWFMSS